MFITSKITSHTQNIHHVLSALPVEVAAKIHNRIFEPSNRTQYKTLKHELTKQTSTSEHQRLQHILSSEEFCNHAPPKFLRRLQQNLGKLVPTPDATSLCEFILQRLPNNVRKILPSTSGLTLVQLTQLAGAVMEGTVPQVTSIEAETQRHCTPANTSTAAITRNTFRESVQQTIVILGAQIAVTFFRS